MTTLELYRKHKKGEVSRDRFLYEVRRDNNLPWVTNTTSYDDAVKILKNKGIISEAQFEPQNIPTDPLVDRVNPYALKREVEKLLAKEPELTNDSYKLALNKAAKKLTTPEAVKQAMFANADSVAKADAKLQTQEVKKNNLKDKANEMKKAKGQAMPKATAAPTKENKKAKKPKGVEVMKDKGVEGTEKVLRETALAELQSFLKKKLNLSEDVHYEYHVGSEVYLPEGGTGKIIEITGGTCTVEAADGTHKDYQMNVLGHAKKKAMEAAAQPAHTQEAKPAEISENQEVELQPGDKIKVTYPNKFKDRTGRVENILRGFVVVTIDGEAGKYSMHVSDVEKIEDEMDEAADVVSYTDASTGQKKVAGVYPTGKGSAEVVKLKGLGVTSAGVDRAK